MDRLFLRVNVQYIDETKAILNTLAIKEIFNRHTTISMKELLKNILVAYEISLKQIYLVTIGRY